MKKILSMLVALALVLSLSIVATPALADVTSAKVDVYPTTVNTKASYNITFNITKTLAIGDTISIGFPSDTTVPTTGYETGDVIVQSTVQNATISPGDISVAVRTVTIKLPIGIGAPGPVTVVFNVTADIKNPITPKTNYTLSVKTSQETTPVTSQSYGIPLPAKSTYEFLYSQPPLISVNVSAVVNVTLKTKVPGSEGYNETRIHVAKAEGPGNVTVEVDDGGWHLSNNYPATVNFTVEANHNQVIPFRFTFNAIGLYTLNFTLMCGDTPVPDGTGTQTFACAGVSVNVPLIKGWNLMSLPIIPNKSAIGTLLANIIDNVTIVWYYDPTIADPNQRWRSYVPGGPTPTLTKIEDGKAYWIDMKNDGTLTVEGVAIVLPGQVPPSYNVVPGWNMVGFKSMVNMTAGDYLDGTDPVRIYKFWAGAWEVVPASYNMTPGLGYWVAFPTPGTIYP
jgi:hypothetical protein